MSDYDELLKMLRLQQEVENQQTLDTLNNRVERLKEKHKQVEQVQYEEELIKCDITRYINSTIANSQLNCFCGIMGDFLWEAWRWFNRKPDDYEEEPEKEDKHHKSFAFVESTIRRVFLCDNEDFELKDMIMYCYHESFEFTYKYVPTGKEIIIVIPDFRSANTDNYLNYLRGYSLQHHSSENVIETLFSSWSFDELRDEIKKFCEVK